MDSGDCRSNGSEPGEMRSVECKNLGNSANAANGDKAGIMYLFANDTQRRNQCLPCRMDVFRLGEQGKGCLELQQLFMGIDGRQPQAVIDKGPCGYIEKLHQVLRSNVEYLSPTMQLNDGSPSDAVRCILLIRQPHQNARIDEGTNRKFLRCLLPHRIRKSRS